MSTATTASPPAAETFLPPSLREFLARWPAEPHNSQQARERAEWHRREARFAATPEAAQRAKSAAAAAGFDPVRRREYLLQIERNRADWLAAAREIAEQIEGEKRSDPAWLSNPRIPALRAARDLLMQVCHLNRAPELLTLAPAPLIEARAALRQTLAALDPVGRTLQDAAAAAQVEHTREAAARRLAELEAALQSAAWLELEALAAKLSGEGRK